MQAATEVRATPPLADQPSLHREVLRAYTATRTRAGAAWPLTAHPADMSDPCRRPMQTDRHGQPPIGVSSCPVGEIRRWGGCLRRPALARSLIRATHSEAPQMIRQLFNKLHTNRGGLSLCRGALRICKQFAIASCFFIALSACDQMRPVETSTAFIHSAPTRALSTSAVNEKITEILLQGHNRNKSRGRCGSLG